MASSRRHACRRARPCPSVRMRQTPEHAGQTGGLPESGHGALLPREAGAVRLPGGENTVLTGGESRMAGDSFRETPCGAGFCFAVRHFCTESRLPRSFPPPDSGFPSAGEGRMWGADGWFLLERERLSAPCLRRSGYGVPGAQARASCACAGGSAGAAELWLKSAGGVFRRPACVGRGMAYPVGTGFGVYSRASSFFSCLPVSASSSSAYSALYASAISR